MLIEENILKLFQDNKETLRGLQKTDLLEEICKIATLCFSHSENFKSERQALGTSPDQINLMIYAINTQNMRAIPEYSPEFFKCVEISMKRMEIVRRLIELSLIEFESGFNELDKRLILGFNEITRAHEGFYVRWAKAVRSNPVDSFLQKQQSAEKLLPFEFLSHYTIVHRKGAQNFNDYEQCFGKEDGDVKSVSDLTCTLYSVFFKEELSKVNEKIANLVSNLQKLEGNNQERYGKELAIFIKYFKQMIECYKETEFEKVEEAWKDLDRIWMDSKYWIQMT